VIVSAHAPAPAEDKRLPFAEAAPGAVGLETFLPALLSLHHSGGLPLLDVIAAATFAPARLIGLDAGRLAVGAPADLVLCDIGAPVVIEADALNSKSKNSPFDRRRLQGRVHMTMLDGRIVHQA
jgi:dihydroorotase